MDAMPDVLQAIYKGFKIIYFAEVIWLSHIISRHDEFELGIVLW